MWCSNAPPKEYMFEDYEFGKKAFRALIFRTSHDVDRQLNDKNVTLDLVLIYTPDASYLQKCSANTPNANVADLSAGPGLVARKRG